MGYANVAESATRVCVVAHVSVGGSVARVGSPNVAQYGHYINPISPQYDPRGSTLPKARPTPYKQVNAFSATASNRVIEEVDEVIVLEEAAIMFILGWQAAR